MKVHKRYNRKSRDSIATISIKQIQKGLLNTENHFKINSILFFYYSTIK